jgi:hypothetical protein
MTLPVFPRVIPADLSGVPNGRLPNHLLVTVDMPGADARCHPQLARALRAVQHDCRAATGVELTNVGHYRSFNDQIALLRQRYVRASEGTRFWDGSWWRRMSGAPVATPGRSDHGWGLAVDAAVWHQGRAVPVYRSAAWGWIREHLTSYGLCWAWDDEHEEPWHWHLYDIGAPAVVAHELRQAPPPPPPRPPSPPPAAPAKRAAPRPAPQKPAAAAPVPSAFDPARRKYWLYPLNPNKDELRIGSSGDTVRYLQGVCRNEVARFAAWFGAQEPERLADGRANPRKLYLIAAATDCSKLAIDGRYGEQTARTITMVQHAFTNSRFDGRRVGRLDADGRVGGRQTWPFIDTLADGVWAA